MEVQQEKLSKEARGLRQRVEALGKVGSSRGVPKLQTNSKTTPQENAALKKSLYELSARYNTMAHKVLPFPIDSMEALDLESTTSAEPGKVGGTDQTDMFGTL